jgi:hypothetical protein
MSAEPSIPEREEIILPRREKPKHTATVTYHECPKHGAYSGSTCPACEAERAERRK